MRTGALLLFLAFLGAPAGALANDEIVVEPQGHAPRTVHLSGLGEPDVVAREYMVSDAAGERRVPITGHSLDRVLHRARVNPYMFGDVEILAAGGSVTLGRDEVVESNAFPDGPPVLWSEGDGSSFLRPANVAGAAVRVGGGGPLTIRLSRPSELRVRAAASARKVDPGDRVTFTATVSGAPGGERVDVSWYFDDGRSGSGSRVTHRFRKRGTYRVVVGATTSPDEPGADASLTVQVGEPRDGPNRAGGGTNRDAGAPDSGVGSGPSGAGSGGGFGAGGGGSGSGGSGAAAGESSSGGREGDSPARDDTAPADEGAAARRSARRRAALRRAAARRERAERRPTPARESGSAAGDARQVSGIELADLSALSSEAGRDALRAARRGRLRDEDDPGSGIPPGVWWALGAAALVGLGGWLESRSRPAARPA